MQINYDLQNGIVNVRHQTGGEGQYRVLEQLSYNTKPYYDIIYIDEHYWDPVSGPYLSFEEAVSDLKNAVEIHEQKNHQRP